MIRISQGFDSATLDALTRIQETLNEKVKRAKEISKRNQLRSD